MTYLDEPVASAASTPFELHAGALRLALRPDLGGAVAGLWHGRQLALTVAVISAIAAGAFKFFATPLPPDEEESLVGRPED